MTAVAQAVAAGGAHEHELAAVAYDAALRLGGEYPGSPPYLASGPRVAHPHASWTTRRVERGEQVHVELAGCVRRYGGALMRTLIHDGELSGELARLEAAIVAGLEAAIAALAPGVRAGDVDAACREPIAQAGFHYAHETGYSIGLAYPPGWNETHVFNLKPGDERVVQAGMTFHLVPHVVLPGIGGIGLSETVLVTADGCEPLTSFPRRVVRV
jgi:Xaa-Pro dipeptidase